MIGSKITASSRMANNMLKLNKKITLIAAVADNGIIGDGNKLPWKLTADMRHFKSATLGRPVIMGRKTYESLPSPLRGRANIVISRTPNYGQKIALGLTDTSFSVFVVSNLEAALLLADQGSFSHCDHNDEIMIVGGAEIYGQSMRYANSLLITHVHVRPDGDAEFPPISASEWEIESESPRIEGGDQPAYTITRYTRLK